METGCKKLLIILNLVYISRYIGRDIKERVSIFFFFFFFTIFQNWNIFNLQKRKYVGKINTLENVMCCSISKRLMSKFSSQK